jgi:hypothetical protein
MAMSKVPKDPQAYAVWFAARVTHGQYIGGKEAPTHYVWRSMRSRCLRPKAKDYANYGGRGITVCDRWVHSFENFLADMGEKPEGLTLDRRDNNGPYSPENCRWATSAEQQNNKRTNRKYVSGEHTSTLTEWAKQLGISKELAYWRMATWGTFVKGTVWRAL